MTSSTLLIDITEGKYIVSETSYCAYQEFNFVNVWTNRTRQYKRMTNLNDSLHKQEICRSTTKSAYRSVAQTFLNLNCRNFHLRLLVVNCSKHDTSMMKVSFDKNILKSYVATTVKQFFALRKPVIVVLFYVL